MNNREEKIELARRLIATGISEDLFAVLCEQFPELKESEDERIRTRLIALVEAFGQGKYKDEMLAYLERQKEPLTPEENMNHPLYLEGFDVGKKVGEVLKEQQPAEWSEENLERAIKDFIYDNDCRGWEDNNGNVCLNLRDIVKLVNHFATPPHKKPSEEQPESELERVARYVYESWNGGTMDDVRRDMDELEKVLNARKEESK